MTGSRDYRKIRHLAQSPDLMIGCFEIIQSSNHPIIKIVLPL
jgi:hypothetical protein